MKNILQSLTEKSVAQLHIFIVMIAVVVAIQVQYIQQGWINPDSVIYLEAAKLFSLGDFKAGYDVFPWPFYSLCIALVNQVTHLGVHPSAQILNVIFFAIATISFINIIILAGGKQQQIIAGGLIWLSSQYMIGGVLEMLLRDEGFWAFYLLSIVFFIRFYQTHQMQDALFWQVCITIATLFRLEAITFLFFMPFLLLFQQACNVKQRYKHFLSANAINIAITILIISLFTLNDELSTKFLGRLNEVFTSNVWQQFTQKLLDQSKIMATRVLGEYLNEFAIQGLLLTFIFVIIVKVINVTGLINIILSILAINKHQQLINSNAFSILKTAAIIAFLNSSLIITKVFVLSGRYVLALSFILMIFASFYLAELLFNRKNSNKSEWLITIIIIILCGGLIKNLMPKSQGYNYLQEAVYWVKTNSSESQRIYYSEPRMRYYAEVKYNGKWSDDWLKIKTDIESNKIIEFDYLVLAHQENHKQTEKNILRKINYFGEIKRFYSSNPTKYVAIYKKNNH